MKKLVYLLLFNSIFWNYGQAQVFQEDFQTVSSLYGYWPYGSCPSISFNDQNNAPVDCLANWRTYKGTPTIGTENGNSYVSMMSQNFLGSRPYVLTEAVYLNSYKLEPNSNYRLVYYVKANYLNGVSGYGDFNVDVSSGQRTPYYYLQGDRCGFEIPEFYHYDRTIERFDVPQNGIPEWEMRTVYFSTENDGEYTLMFYPRTSMYNNLSVQLEVSIDNVSLYKEGQCESKTVTLQNKIISPSKFNPNPTIEGKRIYAGRAVVASSSIPNGDVVVKPNGILNLKSTYTIDLENGFIVEEGGIFDAYVDGSCYQGYGTYKTASGEEEAEEEIITDNEAEVLNKITVFPNPSNGRFILNAAMGIDEIVIYNSLGQEVKGIVNTKNKSIVEVNLMNKVKGVYFLKIRSGNEWTDKKISIE